MSVPRWVDELFATCTNGELQGGKSISYPLRERIRHPKPDQYPYKHFMGRKKVSGTRIPASTLSKFRSKEWTPGPRTLSKLILLRDRINYARLRGSGSSPAEARRHMRSRDLDKEINIMRKTAQTISEQKGVDLAAILWSNMRSERPMSSWESYVKSKYGGFSEPDEEFDDDEEWDQYIDDNVDEQSESESDGEIE